MGTSEPSARAGRATSGFVGIFGGAFDPIHHGHLRIALDACELLGLDAVRLIPLAHAVHRAQPETPAEIRLQMLHAAVSGLGQLVVDERELRRSGPSYTVDTLNSLRRDLPGSSLCLLLGEDAFNQFAGWRDPLGILGLANIAVMQRPGPTKPPPAELQALLAGRRVERLDRAHTGQIQFCKVTQLDIASSDIRRRIADGRSADFLLPPAVLALIRQNGLYR